MDRKKEKHVYYLKNKSKILKQTKKYQKTVTGKKSSKKYYINGRIKIKTITNDLKINGCSLCGYSKCFNALEFHHVNPKIKKFRLNYIGVRGQTNDNIIKELNKCVLLCANCHQEIETKNRMS